MKTAILLVPSVVFDVERNALINPAHAETARIRIAGIEAIRWDDRLFTPHR
jgi:RES domain-containing protein